MYNDESLLICSVMLGLRGFIRVYERFGKHTPVHELPTTMSFLYELTSYSDEELEKAREMPDGSTNRFIQAFKESISTLSFL